MKTFLSKSCFNKRLQAFTVLIVILTAISPGLRAQSLIEGLGGVKTNFRFTMDSGEMPIIEQAILKRGVSDYNYNDTGDSGYGYGYGLQTFHLEFITKSAMNEKYRSKNRMKRKFYEIKLLDETNTLLLIIKMKLREVVKVSNGDDLFTYSINLKKIPMVLLDRAKIININIIKKGKM